MDFIIITRGHTSYKVYKHTTESYNQFHDRSWYIASLEPISENYKDCVIKSLVWQNSKELGYDY